MSELEKFLKGVLMGGVGVVATAVEKTTELAQNLVNKGTEVVEEQKGPVGELVQRGRGLMDDISGQMGRAWDGVRKTLSGTAQPTREEREVLRERLNEMDELEEELDTVGRGLDTLMGHVGHAVERTGDAIARMAETLAREPETPVCPPQPKAEEQPTPEPAAPEADAAEKAARAAEEGVRTMEDELRKALQYIRSRMDAPEGASQPEMQAIRQRLMDFAKDVADAFQAANRPDKPEDGGNG